MYALTSKDVLSVVLISLLLASVDEAVAAAAAA